MSQTTETTQIQITLNGEDTSVPADAIPAVLCALGYDPEQQGVAVAVNAEVVPRSQWGDVVLAAGDRVELVGAKQGG